MAYGLSYEEIQNCSLDQIRVHQIAYARQVAQAEERELRRLKLMAGTKAERKRLNEAINLLRQSVSGLD